MRSFILFVSILILGNCAAEEKKTRSMEMPPPASVPEKIDACSFFKNNDDCVTAKEINFTLAYFLGSKPDSTVYSLSKMDASRPQITKIKNAGDLDYIRKRFQESDYFQPAPGERSVAGIEDIVQFLQDDMEGQGTGRTALQVKNDRIKAIKDAEEKRRLEETEASRKAREKMQKEIDAFPYTFEISCLSNTDDSKIETELCGAKLKPNLKVISENKVIYNFTYIDFLTGNLNFSFKLPKEFSFELSSTEKDSSKLLVVVMKQRVIKDDPATGKVTFGTGKAYTKMGQNMVFVP